MKKKGKSISAKDSIIGKCFSFFRLLPLIGLLVILCQCKTIQVPEKENPPKGIGWTTYNQTYNYTLADMTAGSYGTSSEFYSEVKPNEGSSLVPPEGPQTQGSPQIQKCNYLFTKAKGENK